MTAGPADSAQAEAEGRIADALATIMREFIRPILQHLALARAELTDSSAGLGWATALTVIAFLVGFIGLILLLAGAALALAIFLPVWAAFVSVGAATLVAAAGFYLLARAQSRRCTLLPQRALASLRENLSSLGEQWR